MAKNQLMKKLILAATAATLMFTACKKDSNDETPENQLTVGSIVYKDVYLSSLNNVLNATSPAGGSLQMKFHQFALPSQSGTFKVVVNPKASDEIQIIALSLVNGATNQYTAGYTSGQTATVTVNNGIYKVQFSNISARNVNDSTETVMLSANVSQD